MVRPYLDWKNKLLWKRVDMDNAYWYQCVDLFKHYMSNVLWINVIKSWNAKEVWTNKYKVFDKDRKQIKWTTNLMQWDVIVCNKWDFWHIAIFDHYVSGRIYVTEQNGSGKNSWSWLGKNAIRVKDYVPNFWAGVRRCKKIEDNYQLEINFINAKLKTLWWDTSNTLNYKNSILYKV